MGGWFSFFDSQPLHINENNIRKLKSIRNKHIPRNNLTPGRLRSYIPRKGLKRGHLSHYNQDVLIMNKELNNDSSYENFPKNPNRVGEKKIKNTFNYFQNPSKRGSMRNKISSFVRGMTLKQRYTDENHKKLRFYVQSMARGMARK